MTLAKKLVRGHAWRRWAVDRWNGTPGYLKWAGGILLGALVRLIVARLWPEHWENISHTVLSPTMPIWLAVVGLVAVLMLERTVPGLYRRVQSRDGDSRMRVLFGVRWITPPEAERAQGPYCITCPSLLRGTLWSGDSSPTLWVCPTCDREYSTPEFHDIRQEVEQRVRSGSQSA